MARIKIERLPKDMELTGKEMMAAIGGSIQALCYPVAVSLDEMMRRNLRVSDPSDYGEIAGALRERYG